MKASHTKVERKKRVKIPTFISAAAEFHSSKTPDLSSMFVALLAFEHLCELSKLHLLYLSLSLISGTEPVRRS